MLTGYQRLRAGRVSINQQAYHLVFNTHQRNPLIDFDNGTLLARYLNSTQFLKNNRLLAWVLMPDHVHILVQLGEGSTLESFVRVFKTQSSLILRRKNVFAGKVWDKGYYDHACRKEEDLAAIARYIVANPLRAGLVRSVRDYPFWDAIWL